MNLRPVVLLAVAMALPAISSATGVGPWSFGMTRDAVRARAEFGPYYGFANRDIGTDAGVLDGAVAPISFHFTNDRLTRVTFTIYRGPAFSGTETGWTRCFEHLRQHFTNVSLPSIGPRVASVDDAMAALAASGLREGASEKMQMGASPMPRNLQVWCSAYRSSDDAYVVSLSYAEP